MKVDHLDDACIPVTAKVWEALHARYEIVYVFLLSAACIFAFPGRVGLAVGQPAIASTLAAYASIHRK